MSAASSGAEVLDDLPGHVNDKADLFAGQSKVRGVPQGVSATMDDAQTVTAAPHLHFLVANNGEAVRSEFSAHQQTRALHGEDRIRMVGHDAFQTRHELFSSIPDVVAHFRRDAVKHRNRCFQRSRVGCHRVAVDASDVHVGNFCGHSDHRKRELPCVDRFRPGLHVGGFRVLEALVIDDAQATLATKAGLHGIDHQHAAVFTGQTAGFVVEGSLHADAWSTLALDRFDGEQFDEHAVGVGLSEGGLKCCDIVRRNQGEIFAALEGVQVAIITVHARMGDLGGSVCTAMEGTFNGQHPGGFAFVSATGAGHVKGVHVTNSHADGHSFRTRIHADEAIKGAAVFAAVANFVAQSLDEPVLAERRGHDVGHDVVPRHGIDDVLRTVPRTKHAVTAIVVEDCSVSRDDPRATGSECHVRIDRWSGVEVDEPCLQIPNQFLFVAEHRFIAQLCDQNLKPLLGFSDGLEEAGIVLQKA